MVPIQSRGAALEHPRVLQRQSSGRHSEPDGERPPLSSCVSDRRGGTDQSTVRRRTRSRHRRRGVRRPDGWIRPIPTARKPSTTANARQRYGSVFGQIEYRLTERLNGVASARWDRSTLHDGRVSPRVAAVYTLAPSQTLRVTYGRAFQAANLTEYFLNIPVAPPIDLSPVEAALSHSSEIHRSGCGNVPILAVGNDHLRVERIDSAEVGYQGVIGGRLLVNASVYRNRLKDFITYLLPQVGTSLGRLNSSFGPYTPPSSLSPAAAAIVTETLEGVLPPSLFSALSNDASGRRSSRCCPSAISARRRPPAWNSARPTCCQRAGGSRVLTPDSIRTSATSPRIRCYPTPRAISSAPGGVPAGSGQAARCGTAGWIRSLGWRGFTSVRFRAMASSILTAAIGSPARHSRRRRCESAR